MSTKPYKQVGFTLVEVLVYLGLFVILCGGAVVSAYNIVQISNRNQTKSMVQEEGNFIIAKINWVLSGVDAINQPAVGTSGSLLSINKVTGLDALNQPIITPITIGFPTGDVIISYPNNPVPNTFTLNNSNIKISNFNFTHNSGSGGGTNPESIQASFTINAKTETGADYSQIFSTTVFLRK